MFLTGTGLLGIVVGVLTLGVYVGSNLETVAVQCIVEFPLQQLR